MDNYLRKTMQTTLKNKGTSDEIFMNISNESDIKTKQRNAKLPVVSFFFNLTNIT